jgi:hypothetical protein
MISYDFLCFCFADFTAHFSRVYILIFQSGCLLVVSMMVFATAVMVVMNGQTEPCPNIFCTEVSLSIFEDLGSAF